MSFSKETRKQVYEKTGGKCAYCGCDLPKGWHVDHVVPVVRIGGDYTGKGTDDIENLLPACPSCNIIKSSQPLESFREEIENMYNSINNGTFKIAERFGIVERQKIKVVFYFEKLGVEVRSIYKDCLKKEEALLKEILELGEYSKTHNSIWDEKLYAKKIKAREFAIDYYKNKLKEVAE